MSIKPLALLPLFCATLAAPALANGEPPEAFIWVYNAHYAFDPADTSLDLIATQQSSVDLADDPHLPRGLIWARCLPDPAGSLVAMRFEAFAGAAVAGDVVDFTLQGSGGGSFTMPATIFNAEFNPTGGPEIEVAAAGPELAMMASDPIITYGVVGLTDFIMPFDLSGNQGYVAEFIADCVALGT